MSSAGRRGDGAGRETRLPYRVSAEFDNFGDDRASSSGCSTDTRSCGRLMPRAHVLLAHTNAVLRSTRTLVTLRRSSVAKQGSICCGSR